MGAGDSVVVPPVVVGQAVVGKFWYDDGMRKLFFVAAALLLSVVIKADAKAQPTLTVTDISPTGSISLPQGGQRITMQTLSFAASCDRPIAVRNIAVHHQGPGDTSDIAGVYVMRETERLSKSIVFASRNRIAIVPIRSLTIAPCETAIIEIMMDISENASVGGGHAIGIVDANDVDAGTARIIWKPRLPARAPTTSPASLGAVDATYPTLAFDSTLFGKQRLLLRLQLKSSAAHAQLLSAVTLTNDGKARDADVRSLFMTTSNGVRVTKIEPMLTGNWVRIVFDPPFLLQRNAATLLILRGDVVSSRRRTIHFILEQPSDVEMTATN